MTDLINSFEFTRHGHKFIARVYYDSDMGAPWKEHDGHGPVSERKSRESKRPGERPIGESDHGSIRFYDWQEAMQIALRDGWGLTDEAKAELVARLAKPIIKRRAVKGVYHVENGVRQDKLTYETVTIPGRDPNKPLTRREIAQEAVQRDYDRLDGWLTDQWHWCGVSVTPIQASRATLLEALESVLDSGDLDAAKDVARLAINSADEYGEEEYSYALWGIESDCDEYHKEVAQELADQIIKEMGQDT